MKDSPKKKSHMQFTTLSLKKFHLRYVPYVIYIYCDYKVYIITVFSDLFQLTVIL
jgi:hypothetical protein